MLIVSHILYLRVLRVVTSQCECKEHSDKHDLPCLAQEYVGGGEKKMKKTWEIHVQVCTEVRSDFTTLESLKYVE